MCVYWNPKFGFVGDMTGWGKIGKKYTKIDNFLNFVYFFPIFLPSIQNVKLRNMWIASIAYLLSWELRVIGVQ